MVRLFGFFICAFLLLVASLSCDSTEPPDIVPPPDIIKDTITVSIESFTHRSVTLRVQSTAHTPQSSIKVIRNFNSTETAIAEYALETADTTITDDDNGIGLLLDTTYTYFAVRVDSLGEWKDTSNTVIQKTLAPTSHDYTWQEYTLGDAGYPNTLYDVWGTDENNVWAVGGVKINDTVYGVIKWDGVQWKPIDRNGGRSAIFGFSETDIWVVGGAIFHFDGVEWQDLTYTDPVFSENQSYTSLWGTSSSDMYFGNQCGKIIHWDGVKANIVYEKTGYRIADIEGTNKNYVYAVGGEQGGNFQDLILYFDGVSWNEDHTADHLTPSTVLSLSEQDNYMAGGKILFGKYGNWELQEYPASQYIHKIRGITSNDLIAVGAYNLIMHYSGVEWYVYDELKTPGGGVLYGTLSFGNKVFAVGINEELFSTAKIIIGSR